MKNQNDKDFEWLIVDDGSNDGTDKLIEEYQKENILNIRYFYKENGGKQRAVNFGVEKAIGEYFFIVDSDDFLSFDAVSKIKEYALSLPENFGGMVFRKINIKEKDYEKIKFIVDSDDFLSFDAVSKIKEYALSLPENFGGMVFRKINIKEKDYEKIKFSEKYLDTNPVDIVFKYNILGDKGEIFKTDVLKKYPFPEIEGEKFVPEGYIWNRIGKDYTLRYIDYGIYFFEYLPDGYTNNFKRDLYGIYFFEYLPDGYTNNFKRDLKKNPKGFGLYYRDMLFYKIPVKFKIKFLLRYLQTKWFVHFL